MNLRKIFEKYKYRKLEDYYKDIEDVQQWEILYNHIEEDNVGELKEVYVNNNISEMYFVIDVRGKKHTYINEVIGYWDTRVRCYLDYILPEKYSRQLELNIVQLLLYVDEDISAEDKGKLSEVINQQENSVYNTRKIFLKAANSQNTLELVEEDEYKIPFVLIQYTGGQINNKLEQNLKNILPMKSELSFMFSVPKPKKGANFDDDKYNMIEEWICNAPTANNNN